MGGTIPWLWVLDGMSRESELSSQHACVHCLFVPNCARDQLPSVPATKDGTAGF